MAKLLRRTAVLHLIDNNAPIGVSCSTNFMATQSYRGTQFLSPLMAY